MSSNPRKIGILGGGQLSRMLVIEGHKMGLEMHVLSPHASDPAALVTRHWHQGNIGNPTAVKTFMKQVDIVTIESEFLSDKITNNRDLHAAKNIMPKIEIISNLSDRLKQKAWLERFHIPTAEFSSLLTKSDAYRFLNGGTNRQAVVFKRRRYGYDGYGTYILKDKKIIETWLNKNKNKLTDFIIEDFVKFKRELAIQIAINAKKEVHVFPLVEWQAENAKCLWVKGPTKTKKLSATLKKIITGLKETGYVGLAAFEFFETDRDLLVNEVAPRVHNSGHYSLEALALNQFSAHLRVITNQPLPKSPHLYGKAFAMLNLIGNSKKTPVLAPSENTSLHWYGKSENRAGRKMGHITTLASSPERALKKLLRARKEFVL